ncbi:Type 1 glutamine amidotransferase-like domain-containing protein [[Clostridium] fimetarium]|uniref:Dipeptidase E n=1 Tax=[Clostridium] fimetarium TaxID=99656 RepID=A0A1I0RXT0_9FIRM|nr:Type 1 glutamine amidotransferase-like domain-containing protein [[Clostridium] fimetarium]SEW46296.1 dipeptidase E [[Clostridium] fimetarium]
MKLFLTSSIGGSYKENGRRIPCALMNENHFLDHIKKYWTNNSKCLLVSAEPDNQELSNSLKIVFTEAFKLSNLSLSEMDVCDRRNDNEIADSIYDYDVIMLTGGHVPTQNQFLSRMGLKELLKSYKGIIIGISAGSMNCADVVYAQPELDGEAVNLTYEKYLEGLDLTKINILPHFQEIKEQTLDGLRILEDISLPDSKSRPFYALVDGSYIFVENNNSTLYGEAYWIHEGALTKICERDKNIVL